MSDKSNQNISELMDGEFDSHSSRFLLKRMLSDEKLSRTWNSYHLLRNYLQKEKNDLLQVDMGKRVRSALENRHVLPETNDVSHKSTRWIKPFLGFAIASSVAFMAVLTFQLVNPQASTEASSVLFAENIKTARQLVDPPAARLARVEGSYSRYPSLTPQVGNYLDSKNVRSIDQYPFYYNQEYLRELQNQIEQVNKLTSSTAD